MRKLITLILITITTLLITVPVCADTSRFDVTVKMSIPEDASYDTALYVIYQGTESDIFAELTAENQYQQTLSVPGGSYNLYQIMPTSETGYAFLAVDNFEVTDSTTTINIYIRGEEGYINESLIGEPAPDNLAEYGMEVANKIAREDINKQAELQQEQQIVAQQTQLEENNEPIVSDDEVKEKESGISRKVTEITATPDEVEVEFPLIPVTVSIMVLISAISLFVWYKRNKGGK